MRKFPRQLNTNRKESPPLSGIQAEVLEPVSPHVFRILSALGSFFR
jgi:hypothetical protein